MTPTHKYSSDKSLIIELLRLSVIISVITVLSSICLSADISDIPRDVYISGVYFDENGVPHKPDRPYFMVDSTFYEFPLPLTWPTGLAKDGSNFWVADNDSMRIYRINSSGIILSSFPSPEPFPAGLEWDGTHLWLVCEQVAKLFKLTTDGQVDTSFYLPDSGSSDPNSWGLAWDGQYLWHSQYGDSARFFKLDTLGTAVDTIGPPANGHMILGIAWDNKYLCSIGVHDSTFYWLPDPSQGTWRDTVWSVPYPLGLDFDSTNQMFWNISGDSAYGGHEALYRSDFITGIEYNAPVPENYLSLSAYPNPFNASTVIKYSLEQQSIVQLDIYNILGQHVERLFKGIVRSGGHSVNWNAGRFTSGVYYLQLKTINRTESIKLMLVE